MIDDKISDRLKEIFEKIAPSYNITLEEWNHDNWQKNYNTRSVVSWRGIAFERVCFNHIRQIKKALEIGGVSTTHSAWVKKDDENEEGTQIDLIITRNDNVVHKRR